MSGQKPREIAVQVLGQRAEREFTEDLLERALAEANLPAADRRLCQELTYGIARWQATLDWLIARKTAGRVQKPALQNLLRLGLYQIFWLDRVPPHAAVHVTVELAKQRGFGPQAGFVNALLRGYLRELEPTRKLLEELKTSQPALGYSHPEWLVRRWQARWGNHSTAQLLAWNNQPPRTFGRVNTLRIQPATLLPLWREEEVQYDFVRHDWLEQNLVFELKSHPPLERLPSFQKGFFYIQDPSTLLAVQALEPKPGESVLDLCAAPGGKLTFAAQLMGNQGRILAHDTNPARLQLIADNCTRLGVTCVQLANQPIPTLPTAGGSPERFDKVLVDAPCSNTGVMRRRVDLRWRITLQEITRLRRVQLELLRQASAVVRPGGILIYSTCSLEREENRGVIEALLAEVPGLKLERESEARPFAQGVDGAYVARLQRA